MSAMIVTLDAHVIYFVHNHHFQCKQTLEAFLCACVWMLFSTKNYMLLALLVLYVLLEYFIGNTDDYAYLRFVYIDGIYAYAAIWDQL